MTARFFKTDHRYRLDDDPYKAPEIRPVFRVAAVVPHPAHGDQLHAFGWFEGDAGQFGAGGMDMAQWKRGWTDITDEKAGI